MIINPYLFAVATPPAGGAGATWSPTDKDANILLSNGNLTATGTGGSVWKAVRCTNSQSTLKRYFEVLVNNNIGVGYYMVGIGSDSELLNTYAGKSTTSFTWQFGAGARKKWTNNDGGNDYGTAPTLNDVIGVLVDFSAGTPTIAFYLNGVSQGIAFTSASIAGVKYPIISLFSTAALTARFASTSWSNTPAGATEW